MITGKEFNTLYPNSEVVKLTDYNNYNDEFQSNDDKEVINKYHDDPCYMEGLNVLEQKFDPDTIYDTGGLYCCFKKDFGNWFTYADRVMYNIWTVTIPNNAKVVVMDNRIKVDRFILSDMSDLLIYDNCMMAVKQTGYALYNVPEEHISYKLCLAAVENQGYSLFGVPYKFRTSSLCLTAVTQNGLALEHVPQRFKSYKVCLAALRQNDNALEFLPIIKFNKIQ